MSKYLRHIKQIKNCKGCNEKFEAKTHQLYCSKKCSTDRVNSAFIKSGLEHIATGTVGAIAELVVSADLMRKGYDVYRALSPSCNADILAIKGSEMKKYEVRTGRYYKNNDGSYKLSYPKQRIAGKSVAVLTHSDGVIHYLD